MRRLLPGPGMAVLRLGPVLLTLAVAGALVAVRPVSATEVVAGAGVLAATGAAAWPDSAAPAVTLLLLAGAYAAASAPASPAVRVLAAMAMAGVLWGLHLVHALAAAVPRHTAVAPALVRHWRRLYLTTAGWSLPVVALAAGVGGAAPDAGWARGVGVAAALAVAALPLALTRARRTA